MKILKISTLFGLAILSGIILLGVSKAQAAQKSCNGNIVRMDAGDYCDIRGTDVYYGGEAITLSGNFNVKRMDTGAIIRSSSWSTTSPGQDVACFETHSSSTITFRLTITSGSANIKGSTTGPVCGNVVDPPDSPNLVPRNLAANGSLETGESIDFSARVRNAGTEDAGSSVARFRLDIGNNGSYDLSLGRPPVNALPVGDISGTLQSSNWTAVAGRHKIQFCADLPDNEVAESNEADNCDTLVFRVNSGITASISCSATTTSVTLTYSFSGVSGQVNIHKNDGLIISNVTNASSPDSDPNPTSGPNTYSLVNDGDQIAVTASGDDCGLIPLSETRIPHVTTFWDGKATYGDVHAGGVSRIAGKRGCGEVTPIPRAVRGSTGLSRSSSAVSSTGRILGFGAGGLRSPVSPLRIGNQSIGAPPDTNYNYSICQAGVSTDLKTIVKDLPRCRNVSVQTKCFREIADEEMGFKGRADRLNSCSNDNDNIISRWLQDDYEDVVIVCDTRESNPAPIGGCTLCGFDPSHPPGIRNMNVRVRNHLGAEVPIVIKNRRTLWVRTEDRPYRFTQFGDKIFENNRQFTVIRSNIEYDNTPKNSPSDLPSFAFVGDANLKIHHTVNSLYGYYLAGQQRRNKGAIWTCNLNPRRAAGASSCNEPLEIHGLVSAVRLFFWRTGNGTPASSGGNPVAERVGGSEFGTVFIGSAPTGLELEVNSGAQCDSEVEDCSLHFTETEQPPIF